MRSKNPILLVEDDKVDAITVKRAFTELGIPNQLEIVRNGVETLNFLKDNKNSKPCLILL